MAGPQVRCPREAGMSPQQPGPRTRLVGLLGDTRLGAAWAGLATGGHTHRLALSSRSSSACLGRKGKGEGTSSAQT